MTVSPLNELPTSSLRDYLRVVRRRKWIILQALVLVPAAAVFLSHQQERLYRAEAEVLLSRQNLAATLTGTPDPTAYQQADRIAQTQADLARVPEVARRVLEELGLPGEGASDLLASSEVAAKQNADLLVFRVTDPSPALARRLATEYARQFTLYRRELDTASLERARTEVSERLRELEQDEQAGTDLYASLADKEQQLKTMEALQTSNAFLVRRAEQAAQVQPRPTRNGVLGLVLGLVLGVALAFLREALDVRVRTVQEIHERLGLPLLGRVPVPPRWVRKQNRLVMFAEPAGVHAESFRMVRANLDFARLERDVRTILVTSAVEREGKSTTAANLGVALARAGERVVIVDLDLRRPFIDRLFDLRGRPGVTQVVLGRAELHEALTPITIMGNGKRNGHKGSLQVLHSGPVPLDAGEFVGTHALARTIETLRESADTVIVDAPPLLHVGDAMTLSAAIDAVLVVARVDALRRPMLPELRRLLDAMPAQKLGVVATGVGGKDGYGLSAQYYYRSNPAQETLP